jgi:very-short-patch-repair endonuclease
MSEDSGAATFAPLDRHRSRRLSGIPTVSVLLGECDAAEWLWEGWQRAAGRANVSIVGATHVELLRGWLSDEHVRVRVGERIRARAAEFMGLTTAECGARIAGQSSWQFDDLIVSLVPVLGCSTELVLSALGRNRVAPSVPETERLVADFAWIAQQLGGSAPGLLLLVPAGFDTLPDSVARCLAGIAEAAPSLDFGVAPGLHFSLTGSGAAPRDVALLREGVLRIDGTPVDASTSGEAVLSYDRAEFARSQAERSLYRQLESRPTTQGLFVLNARLDERFGSAPLEVDLLSERLNVALEVDGYHHFRDSTAYRRDRKKDLLLQELGYLVVRVLASDITDEPEHVLELIDRAVARRTEKSA